LLSSIAYPKLILFPPPMTSPLISNSEKKPLHANSNIKISTLQLGVWKVRVAAQSSGFGLQDQIQDLRSSFPILLRLATDIFTLAPGIVLAFLACQIWEGVEDAFEMHISNRLLRTVCIPAIFNYVQWFLYVLERSSLVFARVALMSLPSCPRSWRTLSGL
jgi:hypothetical protein